MYFIITLHVCELVPTLAFHNTVVGNNDDDDDNDIAHIIT